MSRNGGYIILNFGGYALTSGVAYPDFYASFVEVSDAYIAAVVIGGNTIDISIDDDDDVTVTVTEPTTEPSPEPEP